MTSMIKKYMVGTALAVALIFPASCNSATQKVPTGAAADSAETQSVVPEEVQLVEVKALVDTVTIESRFIKSPSKAVVAVPASYLTDYVETSYPTVYLLNGYTGTYYDWSKKTRLDSLASEYGVIIVCPEGRNSWYFDSPVDKSMQMESYFIDELVPYIDSHYNTIAAANGRAITGLSMGGHGAMWLAMRHPDVFGSAGSMSGGVDITKFPDRWEIHKSLGRYASNKQRWADHSVMTLASKLEPGTINIIFDCGEQDFFYDVNRSLDSLLTRRGVEHTWNHRPGKHSWDYWTKSLPTHLDFFCEFFPAQ